ncbi:ABC transporter substrate-binding protein [Ktedonospora formicarum]|uniref:Sugar ABC transporter substrate-binding protein n=1 Tax=Ktedonospora formicarum TaxID=2778364 RepID=A0A8J3MPZ2_9CHLR|nr:sugar ABC transporter substrate-binding protein [Ktedonospora formicarum]GHO42088.1 sugar ABC transporter substrate-binding protein [Ktedonospora formicarum]
MDSEKYALFSQHGRWRDVSRRDFLKRAGYTSLTALGTTSLLAACGTSVVAEDTKPAPKGTKISGELTLVYMGSAQDQASWNALFNLFRSKYPDVTFKAKGIPSSSWAAFFDVIATQIAGGEAFDLIQVATEGQRLFASRGLVQHIDAFIERDQDELADFFSDIHPNLIKWNKLSSPDGKTYYLPGEFNTMCVWYNSEMFHQAGIADPTDNWTWDAFLEIAKTLTKPKQTYGIYVPPAYFAGIMSWLLTNGASTLNADWTQATVASPAAIEATTFMRSLIAQGISPLPGGVFDSFAAMGQGKLAMFGGGRWPVTTMRGLNMIKKLKIAAWPHKTQQGSPIGWNAYPILKSSQNKEAAWAFVKFITSKQASEYFARQGGTIVPPRRSVALGDAFLSNSPAGSEKLYEALDYSTPIPSPDKGNIIQKAIEDSYAQLLTGNMDVAQGLRDLNEVIQENLV